MIWHKTAAEWTSENPLLSAGATGIESDTNPKKSKTGNGSTLWNDLDYNGDGGGVGSASWTEIDIDFGSTPQYDKTFTITDAGVSAASKVAVVPSGKVATGRVGDDWAWDGLLLSALPGTGSFILTALAFPGPVVGNRKVQYQIG